MVSVTPEGNIEWTEKVPKRQVSSNDSGRYSSYAKVVKGDKVYFIFNDNPKNLNYKGDGKWYAMVPGKSIVSLVEIDSDGRVFRTALPGGKLKGIIARPKVSAQINESDLLLYAERKSNKNMLKVRFRK